MPVRPNPLPQINFGAAQNSSQNTNRDRRQEYIALGIFDIFGKRRDTVEADVSQGCKGSGAPDAPQIEGSNSVEGFEGK
jgi:hypothetical protein